MFCRKCGNQISAGSICNQCGFDNENMCYVDINSLDHDYAYEYSYTERSGSGRKIALIISILLLCVIAGGGIFAYLYFFGKSNSEKEIDTFVEYIEDREYKKAYDYLDEVDESKLEYSDKAKSAVKSKYREFVNDFNGEKGYIDYQDYQTLEKIIKRLGYNDHEFTTLRNALKTEESTSFSKNSNEPSNHKEEEESETVKDEKKIIKEANTKVTEYLTNNDYKSAVSYIDNLIAENSDISELKQIKEDLDSNYVDIITKNAELDASNGDYGKAASTLEAAQAQIGEDYTELNNKLKEYKSHLGIYLDELTTFTGNNLSNSHLTDNTNTEHSHGCMIYEENQFLLNENYKTFSGTIALIFEDKDSSVTRELYEIYGDNKLLYTSIEFSSGVFPEKFSIDVSGVSVLKIVPITITDYGRKDELNGNRIMIYDGKLESAN